MILGMKSQIILRGDLALMERCPRVNQQRFRETQRGEETEDVRLRVGYGSLWWEYMCSGSNVVLKGLQLAA